MLNIIGWLVSLFSLALMLFGYWPNFETNPAKHLNRVENILYQSTSRIIWAAALAFIIFSCVMKKGGLLQIIFTQLKSTYNYNLINLQDLLMICLVGQFGLHCHD